MLAIRVSELNHLICPGPPGPIKTNYMIRKFSDANCAVSRNTRKREMDWEGYRKKVGWASTHEWAKNNDLKQK